MPGPTEREQKTMTSIRTAMRAMTVAVATVAAVVGLSASPAQATSKVGLWWSGLEECVGNEQIRAQAQYENLTYQTRATGYVVIYPRAYIQRVVLTEYQGGLEVGTRDVRYTGTATRAVVTGIQTSYLPWMSNYNVPNRADVAMEWSDDTQCTVPIQIGED